ncbi:MAG TPA: SDR family oxidoreductase [Acidimicrobiales bacterium]|nr:SDR family oxidoreductase [Acidimicrobiales bacterium]
MDLGIDGKVALVAAGSRGLGRATALALAAEGVRVMVSGRDADSLDEVRRAVVEAGGEVACRSGDVTDPAEPARLVAAAVDRFGGLDIVVANAGGPPPGRALDQSDAALGSALNANLLTSVRLVREGLPHMRAAGWGRICCITSYTVRQASPDLALSNTARVGLWGWLKTAAHDLASESSGITINMICPGPHATDRMKELGGAGVMGNPADFGSVAAFLCSEQAGFVNGAAIVVDGGATLAL